MELAQMMQLAVRNGRRELIGALEGAIRASEHSVGPESCPLRHFFAPGQYGREITMYEGMVVVGKVHKHAHLNILSKGKVQVFTPDGGLEEFEAPRTWVSTPGTKRTVFVLETAVWITVHNTDLTDIPAIEREMVVETFEEFDE